MGDASARLDRKQLPLFAAIGLLACFMFLDRYLIGFTVSRLTEIYGFAAGEVGLLLSGFYLGFIISTLLGGYVVDRFGARWFVVLMAAMLAAVSFLFGLSAVLPLFIGLRFMAGLGQSAYSAGIPKLLVEGFRSEQIAGVQGKLGACAGFAGVIAATVGQWLLSSAETWQNAYYALGAGFIVTCVLLAITLPRRRRESASARPDLRAAWGSVPTWVLAGAYFLNNIVVVALISWMPSVVGALPGSDHPFAPYVMLGFYVVEGIAIAYGSAVARKRYWDKMPQFILATALVGAIGLVLFVRVTAFVPAVLVMYVAIAFTFISDAAMLLLPYRYVPASVISSAFSIVYVGGYIGGLISPMIVSLFAVGGVANFAVSFPVYAVILLVSSLLLFALPKPATA